MESSIPVSSKAFGEVELELPIREDLSSKDRREVSEEEIPESKPAFDEVRVRCSIRCSLFGYVLNN